jgi:hypothetical protein
MFFPAAHSYSCIDERAAGQIVSIHGSFNIG